jgi:hypothetical protein
LALCEVRGAAQGYVSGNQPRAVERRILIAQGLYALGVPLCFLDTYWSIALFVIVQLYYVIAPTFRARVVGIPH